MVEKIYKFIQTALFIIAIITIAGIGICSVKHIKPCVVVSGSMEPKIMTGSLCFIQDKNKAPQKGDIISFQKGEITIVHRIIKETDSGYITKGDNNDVADPGILPTSKAKGLYLFSIPFVGYAIKFLQTLQGITIFVTFLIVFILCGFLVKKE